MTMATPNIQNEPGPEKDPDVEEVEGILDAHLADLRQRAEDLVASGQAEDLEAAVEMVRATITAEVAGTKVTDLEKAEPGRYLVDTFEPDGTEKGPRVIVLGADGSQTYEDLRPSDESYVEMEHAPEEAVRLPDAPLTAAERRALRGPRGQVKTRLRGDLFGRASGLQ
jgi:hypothetical protein